MNETDWLRWSTYSWFLTKLKWLTRDDELITLTQSDEHKKLWNNNEEITMN
jgi:hypothetical protein